MTAAARRWAPAFAAAFAAALAVQRPLAMLGGFALTLPDLLFVPLVGLAAWLALRDPARARQILRHPLVTGIALYAAAMLLSLVGSTDLHRSLTKLATQAYLLAMPFVVALALPDTAAQRLALRGWLAGIALLGAVAVIGLAAWLVDPGGTVHRALDNGFGSLPPGPYPRLLLSFANPNMMVHFLGLSTPLLGVAAALGWIGRRAAWILGAAIMLAALSAMSPQLAGLALAATAWWWVERGQQRPLATRAALLAAIVLVAAMQVAVSLSPAPQPGAAPVAALPGGTLLYPSVRAYAWADALSAWQQSPWIGRGVGIDPAAAAVVTPSGQHAFLTDAHQQYLSLLAQLGLIGLAAFGWLLWQASGPLRLGGTPLARAAAVALLAGALVQGLSGSFEDARGWWALLGLLLAASTGEPRGDEAKRA